VLTEAALRKVLPRRAQPGSKPAFLAVSENNCFNYAAHVPAPKLRGEKEESEAVVAAGKSDELSAEMVKQHLTV
jgi:hypothetical protein